MNRTNEDDEKKKKMNRSKPVDRYNGGGLYNFRLNICGSPKITKLRFQYIIKPFRLLFEQFPQNIRELRAMIDDHHSRCGDYYHTNNNCHQSETDLENDHHSTITMMTISKATKMSKMFLLNQNSKQQPKANDGHMLNDYNVDDEKNLKQQQQQYCNYNYHHLPLFLTYNGYIDSDKDLMAILESLQKYEDFYLDWSDSFIRSIQLCRPSMFTVNNKISNAPQHSQQMIDIETKDYCRDMVEEFAHSIQAFSNFQSSLHNRFHMIVKMQRNPHLIDYQTHFSIGMRQIFYDLYAKQRQLYYYYQLTYDLIAKNCQKFITY